MLSTKVAGVVGSTVVAAISASAAAHFHDDSLHSSCFGAVAGDLLAMGAGVVAVISVLISMILALQVGRRADGQAHSLAAPEGAPQGEPASRPPPEVGKSPPAVQHLPGSDE